MKNLNPSKMFKYLFYFMFFIQGFAFSDFQLKAVLSKNQISLGMGFEKHWLNCDGNAQVNPKLGELGGEDVAIVSVTVYVRNENNEKETLLHQIQLIDLCTNYDEGLKVNLRLDQDANLVHDDIFITFTLASSKIFFSKNIPLDKRD
ncbi:MAG: hypothetical protein JJU29_06180 [Verrucomicrobia bacterium]|nr:hypothetical protein [Verrucomicrobiota bacterium]